MRSSNSNRNISSLASNSSIISTNNANTVNAVPTAMITSAVVSDCATTANDIISKSVVEKSIKKCGSEKKEHDEELQSNDQSVAKGDEQNESNLSIIESGF